MTLAALVYQRRTGPSYPVRGRMEIEGAEVRFRLPRSALTTSDCGIAVTAGDPGLTGWVEYRRFKTDEQLTRLFFSRNGDKLTADLPRQPAAGKLAYQVQLRKEREPVSLTGEKFVVIRFRGDVPAGVLIPHILIIFLGMLVSTAAGLTALDKRRDPRKPAVWAFVILFVGGMILGPIMQKFAFGQAWTGFPLGSDLTDNKILISLVVWAAALIAGRRGKDARKWVLAASIITLVVFLIPHSLMGSELKWDEPPRT